MILLVFQWQNYFLQRQRAQSAAEAAALSVATELSRIVVEDSNWGFVALGDQPACGTATMAPDGEPIPIVSINTVLAAARLEQLTAQRVNSPQLTTLAEEDARVARLSARRLQRALNEAVSRSTGTQFRDWNGKPVNAFQTGKRVFEQNVQDISLERAKLKQFNVRIGWLDDGSSTLTPRPERTNATANGADDFYKAFTNAPVDDQDFYFAGVSKTSRLVNARRFQDADGEHFSSAILVEAEIAYGDESKKAPSYSIGVIASALPQATPDRSAAGSLVVFFPQGTVRKFPTLRSMIESEDFRRVQPQRSLAINGDFPKDQGAELVPLNQGAEWSLANSVNRAFLDWLRTNHGASRLESVLEVLDSRFETANRGGPNTVAIFDFDKSGNAIISSYSNGGFYRQTVSDRQTFDIVYGITITEKGNLGMSVRNQVSKINLTDGGKHAGQPLFCELPLDYDFPSAQISASESLDPARCRKSYLKGGLAASIEVFTN